MGVITSAVCQCVWLWCPVIAIHPSQGYQPGISIDDIVVLFTNNSVFKIKLFIWVSKCALALINK